MLEEEDAKGSRAELAASLEAALSEASADEARKRHGEHGGDSEGHHDATIHGLPSATHPAPATSDDAPASAKDHHLAFMRRARETAAERRKAEQEAEQRPAWRPRLAPKDRPEWDHRHKIMYSNDGMNPNVRSYFDRWLDAQVPGAEPLGVMKPRWRLTTDAVPDEEKQALSLALHSFSPQGPRPFVLEGAPPALSAQSRELRAAARMAPRPWEQHPPRLPHWQAAKLPKPGGGGGRSSGSHSPSPLEAEVDAARRFFEAAPPGTYAEQEVGDWDSHHHILWCNEQKVGDFSRLNPMQFRSYFDRPRTPDIGARSRELRQARPDGRGEEVSRIVPVWRLEPIPGSGRLPTPEELKARPEPLVARSGDGGSGIGISRSAGSLSATQVRERKWNARHALVFKNDDVSRLDRSYFDRFREPESLLDPDTAKREVRGSVRVWSLEASGTPEEQASRVMESSDLRARSDGRWNDRHHLCFYNKIHPNARSYFERFRDPPSHAALEDSLTFTDPSTLSGPPHRDPTAASERRRREKLREEERLTVQWSLQEAAASPKDRNALEASLRRCDSEPDQRQARWKERRREAWFSSHGVIF